MIEVKQLKFSYEDSKPVIHDIDFTVEEGMIFGFLGPSGAGKTTTQKLIIGLLDGYSGSIRVMGRERRDWGRSLYSHIGVAFEQPALYLKLTALENLQLMASFYEGPTRDPMELLDRVGLRDAAGQRVEAYSKGMRMRLNFIRSLLHGPRLLFLDEPTAGLDPVNAHNVKGIIRELRDEGCTIFLTTHDMTEADQLCDRVALMVSGRLPVIDIPDSLKRRYGKSEVRLNLGSEVPPMVFPLKGLADNGEFLSLLRSGRVLSIRTGDATLEDVFIEVTGRSLQ